MMNFNNIKPIKPKVRNVKMGAVLTWAESPEEIEAAKNLLDLAPRVYILSTQKIDSKMGIFWIRANKGGLRELMANYMTFIPGNLGAVIIPPTAKYNASGLDGLLDFVDNNGMGLAWAAYVRPPSDPDGAPKAFVMASSSLAYLLQDVPTSLGLDGNDWAAWMHKRLANLMMRPRYFDGSRFGIVLDDPKDNDPKNEEQILNAYEISPPTEEKENVKPKKKKKNG